MDEYECISVYLRMVKRRYALLQRIVAVLAYQHIFSGGGCREEASQSKEMKKRGIWGGGFAPKRQSILMLEKETKIIFVTTYTTPLWIHKWNFDPPFWVNSFHDPFPPKIVINGRPLI